jgi:hypothetical protein
LPVVCSGNVWGHRQATGAMVSMCPRRRAVQPIHKRGGSEGGAKGPPEGQPPFPRAPMCIQTCSQATTGAASPRTKPKATKLMPPCRPGNAGVCGGDKRHRLLVPDRPGCQGPRLPSAPACALAPARPFLFMRVRRCFDGPGAATSAQAQWWHAALHAGCVIPIAVCASTLPARLRSSAVTCQSVRTCLHATATWLPAAARKQRCNR